MNLGFIGLGKYGAAVCESILRGGAHARDRIWIESFDESSFKDNEVKKDEVTANLKRLSDLGAKSLSLNQLVSAAITDQASLTTLVLCLNQSRANVVFRQIAAQLVTGTSPVWILTSVSKTAVADLKSAMPNTRIVRYLPNYAVGIGRGVLAAYADERDRTEAEIIVQRVFQGVSQVRFVESEEALDAARIIIGSSTGIVAHMAHGLAKAIEAQGIPGLGNTPETAAELVYATMAGALKLAEGHKTWDGVRNSAAVPPDASAGRIGTLDSMVGALASGQPPSDQIEAWLTSVYRKCLQEYREHPEKFEA